MSSDRIRSRFDDDIPADMWEECPQCHQLLYTKELRQNLWVCGKCGFHFRLSAAQRLQITVDDGSFEEWDTDLPLCDPLEFPKYRGKLEEAREKTGMQDAVITGKAALAGMDIAIGVMESGFRGGSMGWVVGERITRLIERAAEEKLPLIIISASGGARMEESLISLMQMAKTAGATARFAKAGVPYISLLTHPTYGGVTASYAFLGDIIIAEPGAAMGFAGPRVIEVTGMPIGDGVQTAEYQREHGMIDLVIPREEMRETLATLIAWSTGDARGASGGFDEADDALRTEPRPRDEADSVDAWNRVQLARHPDRPYSLDYIEQVVDGFIELHGDRRFGDDGAIVAGLGWIEDRPVAVIGHQKGRQARERSRRNFAMARPEGYRKAMRIMRLANQVGRPIVTLIDTPGAHCLDEAEARGISEAIAANQRDMFALTVPIIPVIIGEGGSGGAIGIGVGDRVLMLENSYYSVIAPESCAAILWRNRALNKEAADALRLTSDDALRLGVIDGIVSEPEGGAHTDPRAAADYLRRALLLTLSELEELDWNDLPDLRYEKFRTMGAPE
ncbi:MAG: acetyl-CoA carboxylase carboxyltransferase subunit alpha [Armatimonadota bacterium]|jgi:acetyl-CoA carboxylase carboxyl transferase alpha subunit/acetyl-CoA carboxylase carboxyl transferase beta subunit